MCDQPAPRSAAWLLSALLPLALLQADPRQRLPGGGRVLPDGQPGLGRGGRQARLPHRV